MIYKKTNNHLSISYRTKWIWTHYRWRPWHWRYLAKCCHQGANYPISNSFLETRVVGWSCICHSRDFLSPGFWDTIHSATFVMKDHAFSIFCQIVSLKTLIFAPIFSLLYCLYSNVCAHTYSHTYACITAILFKFWNIESRNLQILTANLYICTSYFLSLF